MTITEAILKSLSSTAAYPAAVTSYPATIQLSVAARKAAIGGES